MPAIIIHNLDHAVCVLASLKNIQPLASTPPGCYLLSPQNGAASLGAALFQAILDNVGGQYPDSVFTGVLHCGGDAGYALAAIRSGLHAIVFDGSPTAADRISDIARQNNCQLLNRSLYTDPRPLDLQATDDAATACEHYLINQIKHNPEIATIS